MSVFFLLSEDEPYVPCAGEAYRKCILSTNNVWEQGGDELALFFLFFDCFDREADACDSEMTKRLDDLMAALKKHILENHSRLAVIMEEISH